MDKIKVVELFAGVGGFRLGLEGFPRSKSSPFKVVWSNQWEPSTKKQHASMVYEARWPGSNHSNQNLEDVIVNGFESIPDHDMLVGGFPCQDYSVATTLRSSKGLRGKKGVLWWSIEAILKKKGDKRPNYLLLENVDRLMKSPADQRGRDFAIMLRSLSDLDYAIEWRVINAADYGMPQRRRRVFILAYRKGCRSYNDILSRIETSNIDQGVLAEAFPIQSNPNVKEGKLVKSIVEISDEFNKEGQHSPFMKAGAMIGDRFITADVEAKYRGSKMLLEDILIPIEQVPSDYFISTKELLGEKGWKWHKGAKKLERVSRNGHRYTFSEGGMHFPDPVDRPSRTIITGEGGKSPSRFKHVIEQKGKLRRLTPIELERLNMFPDDHTRLEGISDAKRAFFMGNALVVGVIHNIAKSLLKHIREMERNVQPSSEE